MARNSALISAIFLCMIAVSAVHAIVMGIDFGSSSYKAVLVQSKFRLVLNDQSGRKTSTSIAFRNGDRTFSSLADNAVLPFFYSSTFPVDVSGEQTSDFLLFVSVPTFLCFLCVKTLFLMLRSRG